MLLLQQEKISKGVVTLNQNLSLLNKSVWFGEILPIFFELLPDVTWAKRGKTGCGATPGCPPTVAGGTPGQPVALGFEEDVFLCLIFKEQELWWFGCVFF